MTILQVLLPDQRPQYRDHPTARRFDAADL